VRAIIITTSALQSYGGSCLAKLRGTADERCFEEKMIMWLAMNSGIIVIDADSCKPASIHVLLSGERSLSASVMCNCKCIPFQR